MRSLSPLWTSVALTLDSRRTFVNETFAKCTDANRAAVEAELKGAIYRAFERNELWSTDWTKLELQR